MNKNHITPSFYLSVQSLFYSKLKRIRYLNVKLVPEKFFEKGSERTGMYVARSKSLQYPTGFGLCVV